MSRPDRHPPRSLHRPRLLALPLVVLCALAYLGSAAHFTLVQHTTCAEHGEVVHAGEEGLHAQPGVVPESFADSRVDGAGSEPSVSHGVEAHCAHTFFRREGLPPPVQSLLTVEAPARSGSVLTRQAFHSEPVARLRLAPKSSPPLS